MVSKDPSGKTQVTLPADDRILVTRAFDAPRRLVYRAWTTPELVRRWWGGGHGEMKTVDIDLRVGGTWRYVLAGEGSEVAFHGTYREIVENERIVHTEVYEQAGEPEPPEDQVPVNIVTFEEEDGRTTLSYLVQCATKELRDTIVQSGMEAGVYRQMDLLDEILAGMR